MCGIAGIFFNKINKGLKKKVYQMGNLLDHRGPDDSGLFENSKLIMIHKRLSIIDVIGGKQPIENSELVLIANGEIYNDLEIRNNNKDFIFKTGSDCESILCVYKKFGINGFKKLRGMFAFAIYDKKQKELILGRDEFGIKPLYFSLKNNNFIFSSEIQSMIRSNLVSKKICEKKKRELLQIQFCSGRETIFEDVYRLRTGEVMVVKDSKIRKSYILNKLQSINTNCLEEKDFEILLKKSVYLHQRSDVPYGIFFSGGIDSTLVLYLMSKINEKKINSYCVIFPKQKEKRQYLSRIAKNFNSEINFVEFEENDFWKLLPKVAKSLDDPIIDYASVPTFKLAQEARKDVKVILTGEGGDELFGGYGRYRTGLRRYLFKKEFLKRGEFDKLKGFSKFLYNWDYSIKSKKEELKNLDLTELQKSQYFDFQEWLPNDLLIKLDRCLMANGLEGRTPLIDKELFRNFFKIKDDLKIKEGKGKYFIRKLLNKNIPFYDAFEKKEGFTVPLNLWIPKRCKFLSQTLPKLTCLKEIFPSDKIEDLCKSLENNSKAIIPVWRMIFYSLWFSFNFENKKIEGDTFEILNDII